MTITDTHRYTSAKIDIHTIHIHAPQELHSYSTHGTESTHTHTHTHTHTVDAVHAVYKRTTYVECTMYKQHMHPKQCMQCMLSVCVCGRAVLLVRAAHTVHAVRTAHKMHLVLRKVHRARIALILHKMHLAHKVHELHPVSTLHTARTC